MKKARNIPFMLLIQHAACQNLSLLNDHTYPVHNGTPGANLGFQENEEFLKDSQLTDVVGVHGDNSECVHIPWGQHECSGVLSQSSYLVYTGSPVRAGPLTQRTVGGV